MYKTWNPVIKNLPDEAAGKLIKAVAAYMDDEEPEIDDPMLQALFMMMRQTFEIDAAKYEETIVERNRQNGRKGGRPRKESAQDETDITSGFFC